MVAIDFDLSCINCGHSLKGADLEGICSRCKNSVADTLNLDVIDRNMLTVCDDVLCISCGHNLRTLKINSLCPQCSAAVNKSLYPDELRFADKTWLRKVQLGMILLAFTLCIMSFNRVLWFLYVMLDTKAPPKPILMIMCVVGLLTQAVFCLSVYVTTTPDPYRRSKTSNIFRWGACVCACLSLVYLAVLTIVYSIDLNISELAGAYPIAAYLLYALSDGVIYFGVACLCLCLRSMAYRARHHGLYRMTNALIGFSIIMFVMTCFELLPILNIKLFGIYFDMFVLFSSFMKVVLYPACLVLAVMYIQMLSDSIKGKR